MKKTKKIFSLILALVLCVNLGIGAFSSSGGSSASVTYEVVNENTLVFSGSGTIIYDIFEDLSSLQATITTLVINEGIAAINSSVFAEFSKLTEIYIPLSMKTISSGAFNNCNNLTTVYYAGDETEAASISIGIINDVLDRENKSNWVFDTSYSSGDDSGSGGDTPETPDDSGTPEPVALSFGITSAETVVGTAAVVELKITEGCSRIGATLDVSAVGADGAALPLSGIELLCTGCTNENNSGRFVLAYTGELAAGATIARFTFDTTKAAVGDYTVSVVGDLYTGSDNAPVDETIGTGTITVKEPTVTITWRGDNGEVLQSGSVNRGDEPSYTGATPTKASDRTHDYVFDGWDKEIVAATEDTTYTAKFQPVERKYVVSLDCDISGAAFTVTDSGGAAVEPSDGKYSLLATQTYTATVSAIGYESASVKFSISADCDGLTVDEATGTAALSIAAPDKRMGDIDNNGVIEMLDAQALFNYLAENISVPDDGILYENEVVIFNLHVADINDNGTVGADDILPMLDKITVPGN